MANGNDGSGKSDPKKGNKPDGGSPDPKKPTPIIDLKATEVKAVPTDAAKRSEVGGGQSAAKSDPKKPDTKAGAGSAAKSEATKTSSGVPPVAAGPGTASSKNPADKAASDKVGDRSRDESKSAASDKKSGSSASTAGPGSANADKSDDKARSVPPPPPAARSGGGFLGGVSHLLAGIAGGALVLFGAQPIEKQLGTQFIPRAEVPAEIGTRLVALEQRPAAQPAADVGDLSSKLAELQTQMAGVAELRSQVSKLSSRTTQPPASAANGTQPPAQATDGLRGRVAKLEQTLETLASATGANGQQSDVARLAAISGKVSDIETSLASQITALRNSVSKELETGIARTTEASAAAQAGTKRIDRELAQVKTDAARLEQRAETIKAAQASLDQAVRVAREEAAKLRVDLDALKGDVAQEFKSVAKPADVKTAVAPVTAKISALEQQLTGIVESETARKANAKRIVMALELGNLKRVLNRGGPYTAELGEVKRITGDAVDLSVLEKFQANGVPTSTELQREFSKLSYSIIRAAEQPKDGTLMDRLLGGAKSLVRVRRADLPATDKSVEATVARIEARLMQGNLTAAMDEAKKLPEVSAKPATPWLERVAARAQVDRAISAIENNLKSSLGASAGTKG